MMTDELKPCPFCGGEAACIEETAWRIGCDNGQCAAEPFVWEPSNEMAIAAWNTRAANPLDDPRVKALVEALRDVIDEYDRFRKDEYERGLSPLDDEIDDARAALSALEENK